MRVGSMRAFTPTDVPTSRAVIRDVVVVGAGPAGLSAAAELSRTGDCLLIDQGRGHHERDRHAGRDILAGIGGAGLFSDGKHSFYPSASALWTLPEPALLAAAFDRTAAFLAQHGVTATPWRPETTADPTPGSWHFKKYPSIYMGLEQRMAAISGLAAACADRWTGARVVGAAREGASIVLQVRQGEDTVEVRTKHVIMATGRLSPRELRPWLVALGVEYVFRRLEFGLRIEAASDAPLFRRLEGTDPKLRFCEPDGVTEARSFCVCRDGEVVLGESADICAYSGRADGPASGRSNLGLLVRTRDPALARAVEPWLFASRPRTLRLAELDRDALLPSFGEAGAAAMLRALARLGAWCPELAEAGDAVAHMPCIEGVGDYPDDDGALQAAPGVWLAGDGGGRFRGIVASMVSGRYVAARISRASR